VQLDPIKPKLKLPGTERLKLICDELLSKFAFNFNLGRYSVTPLGAATMRSRWMAALELMRCGAEPRVRVCETEGGVTAV